MSDFGASAELVRREAEVFLEDLKKRGPFDRIVNLHLTRAAGIIAGATAADRCAVLGPAIGESLHSDTWSDFFIVSSHFGFLPEIPVVERYSLIAGEHQIVRPAFSSWRRSPSRRNMILFQPGAGWPSKRIPPGQALEIARALARLGRLIVTGGPEDGELYQELAAAPGVETLWGRRREQLDALAAATLVVTADTWSLHAAGALDVPTLAILGPTRVFPLRHGWALAPNSEASWSARGDTTIERISPDAIAAAAEKFLETGDIVLERPGIVVWDCRGNLPVPSRPSAGEGPLSEKRLFSWARAKAFNGLVEARFGDLRPRARLRPRGDWGNIYENSSEIMSRAGRRLPEFVDGFHVYESTFPMSRPENVAREWAESTLQLLLSGE